MKKNIANNSSGVVLIELLISIVIMVILTTGSLSLIFPAVRSAEIGRQREQAKWLLWEEEEAVRQVRNEGWTNFTPGTYFPVYNAVSNPPTVYQGWALDPGEGVKNGFNESIVIAEPDRVNSNQLSDSTGSPDNNVRKIVSTVSWESFGQAYTMTLTSYLTNWQPF